MHEEIDRIVKRFYDAFTNAGGVPRNVDVLYELFHPDGRIAKTVGGAGGFMTVREFVEPRRIMLSDGSLVDFFEEETSHQTHVFGSMAQRFSRYRKQWIAGGAAHTGGGAKSLQFVRTPGGWKIISLVWDDDPAS